MDGVNGLFCDRLSRVQFVALDSRCPGKPSVYVFVSSLVCLLSFVAFVFPASVFVNFRPRRLVGGGGSGVSLLCDIRAL